MRNKKNDKKLSKWKKWIQQRKRRNNRKYIMEKPRFKKIFMKYLSICICMAVALCYFGTNMVVADYRHEKNIDFNESYHRIESDLKESYYEIMNQSKPEKMEIWKSDARWIMNQRSILFGKKYAVALYDEQTREPVIETKAAVVNIYVEDVNNENEKAIIYECPMELVQEALIEYDKRDEVLGGGNSGFVEDTIYVRFVMQDLYIKGGEFRPGKLLLIQTDRTAAEAERDTIIQEYNFTPENASEYEHLVVEGNEEIKVLGPMWFDSNKKEVVNELLVDYVKSSDDVWEGNDRSTQWSQFWGNQQIRNKEITLGEDLQYRLVMAGESNLFDEYGKWIVLAYVGVLLLAILVSIAISYRTYMLRLNHYQLDTYRRETTNAMAHDLKTPLMAISGYAENLRANVHSEKKDYYADTILEHVKYMNEMVGNILELAKVENVEWILEKEDVNLKSMTEDILKKYEILTLDKKLRVAIEGECVIQADNSLMKQAIENLIGNAMKYAAEDTEIQIKIAEGVYEIRNTIDGALDTSVEELWKPFVKGDNCRNNQKGTGIGLTIVKNIVEAHGFELSLQCEEQEFVAGILF